MNDKTLQKIRAELEKVVADKQMFADTVVRINGDTSNGLISVHYDGGGYDWLSMSMGSIADFYRGKLFAIAEKHGCYFEDYASYRMDMFLN